MYVIHTLGVKNVLCVVVVMYVLNTLCTIALELTNVDVHEDDMLC